MASVTQWIHHLKGSQLEPAAAQLWARYIQRVLRVARWQIGSGPRAVADEEDVASRAFEDLVRGVRDEKFSQLHDRDDLWQILITLAERRAIDQHRKLTSQTAGGKEPHEAIPIDLHAPEPTPEMTAELAEEYAQRLEQLADDKERLIAQRRMQGHSNEEIASELQVSLSTVERKLRLIRQTWEEAAD